MSRTDTAAILRALGYNPNSAKLLSVAQQFKLPVSTVCAIANGRPA